MKSYLILIACLCVLAIGCKNSEEASKNTINCPDSLIDDRDGKIYKIVKIGKQCWMAENLNYNPGSGSWAYDDDESKADIYGRLYDGKTACKVCPEGWHLPSDAEWTRLTDYLGGEEVSGGKLKETGTDHWASPNEGASNESGFSALPGGNRVHNGPFNDLGKIGAWWSSSKYTSARPWFRELDFEEGSMYRAYSWSYKYGRSVRCIKD